MLIPKANNKLNAAFYPITEVEARDWYKNKYINTPAYLMIIKRLLTRPEANFVIPNVLKFCEEWEISKSAFYRAINVLCQDGQFDWEATQGIILKPSQKVVSMELASISSEEKCPIDGTVSHKREADSHEREVNSHERDNTHAWDTPPYIDLDQDRSNRSNSDLPLNPPNSEGAEKQHMEVRVEVSASHKDDLLERYNNGEITQLPRTELIQLAKLQLGELVKLYRKSAQILNSKPNDIEQDFLEFIAIRDGKDKVYADRLIKKVERSPDRWSELVEMVKAWATGESHNSNANSAKQKAAVVYARLKNRHQQGKGTNQ